MNKAGKRPTVAEESQPWNNQTVQVYSLNSFWMDDGVWNKMCDWLTELEMAVNAWVAFATKKIVSPGQYFKYQQQVNDVSPQPRL